MTLSRHKAGALLDAPLPDLLAEARELCRAGHGTLVTYSPKVFIPLTVLCRDVCHYCTFAKPHRRASVRSWHTKRSWP